jgi:hypothetical protein
MLKTSKPAAVFSISIPGDFGGYGARGINQAGCPAVIRSVRRLPRDSAFAELRRHGMLTDGFRRFISPTPERKRNVA